MRPLKNLFHLLRSLGKRQTVESDMVEEMETHIALEAAAREARGVPRAEALRQARIAFGSLESVREEGREARGFSFFDALSQDMRFGLRGIRRSPGFALAVVLTLALGIGANTAIFSVVHGVLLKELPYGDADRIVRVYQVPEGTSGVAARVGFSVQEFTDLRSETKAFSALAEYHSMRFLMLGGKEPERVQTGVVSANYFDVLGVAPLHGRTFRTGEDAPGSEPVLVLSYEYWERVHGGDLAILGKVFQLNDHPHTVVGILPPLPRYPNQNDVFMPASACPFRARAASNRAGRMVALLGRLAPGATPASAEAELTSATGRMFETHRDAYPPGRGMRAEVVPVRLEITGGADTTLWLLFGTVALILLIACANVANLMLARLAHRAPELALRGTVGASAGRIVRQLVTEATLLSLTGGFLGLVLAVLSLKALRAIAETVTPAAAGIGLHPAVLAFTLCVSVLTGLVFGGVPALSRRQDLSAVLQEGGVRATPGRGAGRLRSVLVASQLALSFVLVIGAALVLRSFWNLTHVDPGFRTENVLTMTLDLNWSKYLGPENRADQERMSGFYQSVLTDVRALPGVTSAAGAVAVPLNQGFRFDGSFRFAEREHPDDVPLPRAAIRITSADYFATLGIPLLSGRLFDDRFVPQASTEARTEVMVNRAFQSKYFPKGEVLGQRVSFDGGRTWSHVVGVVGDARQYGLAESPTEELILPFSQNPGVSASLLVRTPENPKELAARVIRAIRGRDAQVAVVDVRTLEDVRRGSVATSRLVAWLLSGFAGLALAISAAGIGGVLAFHVSQRIHEIGVRLALGAEPGALLRLLVREAMAPVVLGLVLGVIGALAGSRLVSGVLFGVSATDPACFAGSSLTLLVVAFAACVLPAWRAATTPPMLALRSS
ncbi:MAG: ABC transporter permease [Acidobacteria bacterium]|nr:ABC transporter permease [Acidobacteriota bacterium]